MSKIEIEIGNNNKEYYFYSVTTEIYVRFTFDKNNMVVKTLARIITPKDSKFRHEIKKVRYCKTNRNLEIIINQESFVGNDVSKTELSSNTYFDLSKGEVQAVKITYLTGETYIDENKCYKDLKLQPEVKDGNIFVEPK